MNLQVLVVGENVAEQLAKYDGNREGPFVTRMDRRTVQQLYEVHRDAPKNPPEGATAELPEEATATVAKTVAPWGPKCDRSLCPRRKDDD